MPDLATIQTKIGVGKAYCIEQLDAIYTKMQKGSGSPKKVLPLERVIRALQFQVDAQINNNKTTSLYNCLIKLLQGFSGAYVIDPAVIIPGQTTIVITQTVGYNEAKIPFVVDESNSTIILSNYHTLFYPLYGNNPDLALYDQQGQPLVGDQQTPPNILYVGDNYTADIISITWNYPPLPGVTTTGYVRISGKAPNSGGTGTIPGTPSTPSTTLTFTEVDLHEDGIGSGNWYLPLGLLGTSVPILVTTNGLGLSEGYNSTFTPPRYYGFANNDTQVIKVTII